MATKTGESRNPAQSVFYGAKICLKHAITGKFLSSFPTNYEKGSKQQIVFCTDREDGSEWWEVCHGSNSSGSLHEPVRSGSVIRLRHHATSAFLHSHTGANSPASGQQEVTCYHGTDANDDWKIETKDGSSWTIGDSFRLVLMKRCPESDAS